MVSKWQGTRGERVGQGQKSTSCDENIPIGKECGIRCRWDLTGLRGLDSSAKLLSSTSLGEPEGSLVTIAGTVDARETVDAFRP